MLLNSSGIHIPSICSQLPPIQLDNRRYGVLVKASVFIATSLDGFIARQDGDIAWLDTTDAAANSNSSDDTTDSEQAADHGYKQFMSTIDTIVMGRNTYEKVRSFDIPWPYETKVAVLTNRPLEIPDDLADRVFPMHGSPQEIITELQQQGSAHLYIDGGRTVLEFLNAGLIQRMIITRIPILLGDGIPLFGPLSEDIRLRHIKTQSFHGGLVQTEYQVID